jgi:predicted nucleotidyltransferase component of viral defense system
MLSLEEISRYYPPSLHPFKRNILREYLQHKILDCIYGSPYANQLIFMGGTALRILHEHTRFSEDLDFDNRGITPESMDLLADIIQRYLEREGYEIEIKTIYKTAYHCHIRLPKLLYDYGLSGMPEEKILIQLDAEPQRVEYTPEKKFLNRFDVFTQINVVPLPTLLSQKIYAAFNRKRLMGRDFYDILFLWPKTQPDYEYLDHKLHISIPEQLKKYLVNSIKSVDFISLSKDLEPFVFTPKDAQRIIYFPEWVNSLVF